MNSATTTPRRTRVASQPADQRDRMGHDAVQRARVADRRIDEQRDEQQNGQRQRAGRGFEQHGASWCGAPRRVNRGRGALPRRRARDGGHP
jgi:hypothetical protein